MIIVALAAIVFYCVYTYHKDHIHIKKLLEDRDAQKEMRAKIREKWRLKRDKIKKDQLHYEEDF